MSIPWYEVWVDDGLSVPYILVVQPDEGGKTGVVVIDPKENNQIVHRTDDYESAKLWLLEDEYKLVDGRMTPE